MSKTYELWDMTTNNLVEAYGSEADALAFVRAYVAELCIPDDESVRLELDNGGEGHCTIWGEPAVLLGLVRSVTPV